MEKQINIADRSKKKVLIWYFLGLCVPLLFYAASVGCGWRGLLIGRFFQGLYFASWLFSAFYFGVRATILFPKTWYVAILNSALTIVCFVGAVLSHHATPFLDAFESKIKHTYNVSKVQTWATDVLKTTKWENSNVVHFIKREDYPNWAVESRFPIPDIGVIHDKAINKDYVKIAWGGSGVGIWGVIVGDPTLSKQGRKWADGVYFFVSPRPSGWRD